MRGACWLWPRASGSHTLPGRRARRARGARGSEQAPAASLQRGTAGAPPRGSFSLDHSPPRVWGGRGTPWGALWLGGRIQGKSPRTPVRVFGWDSRGTGSVSIFWKRLCAPGPERCRAQRPPPFTWTLCNWWRRPGVWGRCRPSASPSPLRAARSHETRARRDLLPCSGRLALPQTLRSPGLRGAHLSSAHLDSDSALMSWTWGFQWASHPSPSGDTPTPHPGDPLEMGTRPIRDRHPTVEVVRCVWVVVNSGSLSKKYHFTLGKMASLLLSLGLWRGSTPTERYCRLPVSHPFLSFEWLQYTCKVFAGLSEPCCLNPPPPVAPKCCWHLAWAGIPGVWA